MNKYKIYEKEKRKLQQMNLTPSEYEEKLKKIAKRLGI